MIRKLLRRTGAKLSLFVLALFVGLSAHQSIWLQRCKPTKEDCEPKPTYPSSSGQQQYQKSSNVKATTNETVDGEQTTMKYLLLSTDRSGSTWTCSLLDLQENILCGYGFDKRHGTKSSELMVGYSSPHKWVGVEWSKYEKSLDDAFEKGWNSQEEDQHHHQAFGFKLMYYQIPYQFVQDGLFQNYLKERNISILHLVREAKILKLASRYNNRVQLHQLKDMHTSNITMREEFRNTSKMPWNDKTVNDILQLEKESEQWQNRIQFANHLRVHYLSYENLLLEEDREDQLRQVIAFLQPPSLKKTMDAGTNVSTSSSFTTSIMNHAGSSSVKLNSPLLQLHESTCSKRVEDYETFRMHPQLNETRTVAACEMLENYFGGE